MDIATSLGLLSGIGVTCLVILMGGDLHMFVSEHAAIVIFGGSFAATLIRFPLSSIMHGLPLGAKFAFSMRRMTQRELVDELAGLAEIARKQGPMGLEKVEIEDPFLAKGVRFVADGYDTNFIRDNLERDRDNFLTHLDEGQKIYRAIGDCAPAFGMIGTLIGMVQMFANMTDPSKLGPYMAGALLATFYGDQNRSRCSSSHKCNASQHAPHWRGRRRLSSDSRKRTIESSGSRPSTRSSGNSDRVRGSAAPSSSTAIDLRHAAR